MRFMIMAAAVAALAFASTAEAKSCKDAKGHFIKCPAAAAAPAKPAASAKPCKDVKGHFIKCGTTAAAPAMAAPAAKPANKPATAARASGPKAAPKCKTGIPCGDACIPKGKVCHKT
jgi:hypothetical protein